MKKHFYKITYVINNVYTYNTVIKAKNKTQAVDKLLNTDYINDIKNIEEIDVNTLGEK